VAELRIMLLLLMIGPNSEKCHIKATMSDIEI